MFKVGLRFDNKHREEDGKIIEKSSIFVVRICSHSNMSSLRCATTGDNLFLNIKL